MATISSKVVALGTFPKADVLVRNGLIADVGPELPAEGAEVVDASRMIVMPGFIHSHFHMWSTIGRNFLSDGGFEYYQAGGRLLSTTVRTIFITV